MSVELARKRAFNLFKSNARKFIVVFGVNLKATSKLENHFVEKQ